MTIKTKAQAAPKAQKAKAVQAVKPDDAPITAAEQGSGVVPTKRKVAVKMSAKRPAARPAKPAAKRGSGVVPTKRVNGAKATKAKSGKAIKGARSTAIKAPAGLLTQAKLARAAGVSLPTASKYRNTLKAHHVKSSDGRAGVLYRATAVEALRKLRDGGLSRRGVYERQ